MGADRISARDLLLSKARDLDIKAGNLNSEAFAAEQKAAHLRREAKSMMESSMEYIEASKRLEGPRPDDFQDRVGAVLLKSDSR